MQTTEVFADALLRGDVILHAVSDSEAEIRTVEAVNPQGLFTLIYVDEGAPIQAFTSEAIQVIAGPSHTLAQKFPLESA